MQTPVDATPAVPSPGMLQSHQVLVKSEAQPATGNAVQGLPPFSAPPLDLRLPSQAGNPAQTLKDLFQQQASEPADKSGPHM